ncbi:MULTISPECIES: hypothetical protein [unclassified Pseudomonas]|jgi:hypothetical protein|uniref:hypothetical protein n=1 Tax=unclassified Pseudomonas TaxID=196821 RepID=UPI00069E9F4D|nr:MULTISPECIES: hypothetical protein [unclassified Pseudomonas]WPN48510.1 hypothetical protein QMK58_07555 [Pseudomonas sp. P8_241]
MSLSRLTAFALTALLSSTALAGTIGSSTGPTNPVEKPQAPAIQSAPGMNTNGTGVDNSLPPSTGTDPRIQGNDAGRQGGLNVPDTKTPSEGGLGSTTTDNQKGGMSQ